MPKPYRSKGRLVLDVLAAIEAEGPTGVTRLLVVANLTHARLHEQLGVLEEKGWIHTEEGDGRPAWVLTEDGRKALAGLRRIDNAMRDFGLGL